MHCTHTHTSNSINKCLKTRLKLVRRTRLERLRTTFEFADIQANVKKETKFDRDRLENNVNKTMSADFGVL